MKTFIILITGVLAGIAGMQYYAKRQVINHYGETKPQASSPKESQKIAKAIAANVVVNGEDFIEAAKQAEAGKNEAFDTAIYELGEQLNESIENSLHLSGDAKKEMDELLKENYPEISEEARKAYLEGIKNLPNQPVATITSTEYSTRADVLSGAINSTVCGFATLIFIPLNLNFSLSTNIAACYFLQNPCEILLSGVMDRVGQQIYLAGIVKDIEITRSNLLMQKQSALAELATAEMEMKVNVSHTIDRTLGEGKFVITKWEAAKLSIQYNVSLKYGYDLGTTFQIERNDARREIVIHLPEPQLININLEPVVTDADDGGFPDLNNSHFRLLYEKAEDDAVQLAEKKGIKKNAQDEIRVILTYMFEPFIKSAKYPYHLQFTTPDSNNIKNEKS